MSFKDTENPQRKSESKYFKTNKLSTAQKNNFLLFQLTSKRFRINHIFLFANLASSRLCGERGCTLRILHSTSVKPMIHAFFLPVPLSFASSLFQTELQADNLQSNLQKYPPGNELPGIYGNMTLSKPKK